MERCANGPLHPTRRPFVVRILLWAVPSVLLHVLIIGCMGLALPLFVPDEPEVRAVSLVIVPPPVPPEEENDPETPDLTGQLVDVSPPEVEEKPDEADYLADYDQVVEEETQADRVKVNPEVLARSFSREEQLETEDLFDLNIEKPSTGAQVGNNRFDPDVHGTLAALPHPWERTNKEGVQDPTRAYHANASRAGAPQNDWLDLKRAPELAINSKEYLYNAYIQRIRRLVNFYWQQNLDNLPSSVHLGGSHYVTEVEVILNADGALEQIEVVDESGVGELDDAVVRAFRLAGPFSNPPEGLIEPDGRVYLPEMDFRVNVGTARASYQGIDPRAGVQFPGILKSPR